MPKIENPSEQIPETGPITDPEKLNALRKSLKKGFNNISEEPGEKDFVADRIRHILEKTPDEFVEKGIEEEIH